VLEGRLKAGSKATEEAQGGLRIMRGAMFLNNGPQGAAPVRREATEEVLELGSEELPDEEGPYLGEESLEGNEGFEGVAAAGMERGDDPLEAKGQLPGISAELTGKMSEVAGGQGVGVIAGGEGVEIAERGAAAVGAKLGIAVGAAASMAAHSPVATAGHGAGCFVAVPGHDPLLDLYYSTNVRFCQVRELGDWGFRNRISR
jgi:hypothetical protein